VPIAKLFVEGTLEVQLFAPILLGSPVPYQGGSKYALKPRARTERRENQVAAGYLRDRDFDFDPPADLWKPTEDGVDHGIVFGWRWCRHEIENYLIDPAVVGEVTAWPVAEIEEALRAAGRTIRSYQVARWTIGLVRRALPPHYELRTRPDGLNELELPSILDSARVNEWASQAINQHRGPMVAATDAGAVQNSLDAFAARFDDAFVDDVTNILVWFSGKDLLAGMAEWLLAKAVVNPGAFRALLRDWIIANPERALVLLPEWNALVEALRA